MKDNRFFARILGSCLTPNAWLTVIAARDDLVDYPIGRGSNLLTGETPPKTSVCVVHGAREMGVFAMLDHFNNNLIVSGDWEDQTTLLEITHSIATALNGEVTRT